MLENKSSFIEVLRNQVIHHCQIIGREPLPKPHNLCHIHVTQLSFIAAHIWTIIYLHRGTCMQHTCSKSTVSFDENIYVTYLSNLFYISVTYMYK